MKRFHVHVSVPDLPQSIAFYSKMFGTEPSLSKPDYAKWMLDEPRLNFAISARGAPTGINHLGFQVDSEEELSTLRESAEAADLAVLEEDNAACCYARSTKHWITDPAGIAWESFHSLAEIPVFGDGESTTGDSPAAGVCCPTPAEPKPTTSCCG